MNCLQRADEIVHGDRNAAYGEPAENHKCTAEIFNAAMRKKYPNWVDIETEDVCWFNVCQKISREMNSKTADGLVDIPGYIANVEIIREGWKVAEIREQRNPAQTEARGTDAYLIKVKQPIDMSKLAQEQIG